jgi:hypothetical protein
MCLQVLKLDKYRVANKNLNLAKENQKTLFDQRHIKISSDFADLEANASIQTPTI